MSAVTKKPSEAVNTIHLGWAVEWFGGMGPAVVAAESRALILLQRDQDSSLEWATAFLKHARGTVHKGDCDLARSWLAGPITCPACVYDEVMLKAWLELWAETEHHLGE